jgi:hypothetical protein
MGASCYLPLHAFNPTADLCADPVPFEFLSIDNLPPKAPSAWKKLFGSTPARAAGAPGGVDEKKVLLCSRPIN